MTGFTQYAASVCVAAVLGLQGCAPYHAVEFNARLVDADTGQPIEGAIVVAHWQILGGLEGGNPLGEAMIMETVTDKIGTIHFPSWSKFSWKLGSIKSARPELLIFKDGYKYLRRINESQPTLLDDVLLRSDWNGKTLVLEQFRGTPQEYAKNVAWLDSLMYFARRGRNCEWKATPRMLVALHLADTAFESRGIAYPAGIISKVTDVDDSAGCGPAAKFFEDYLRQGTPK